MYLPERGSVYDRRYGTAAAAAAAAEAAASGGGGFSPGGRAYTRPLFGSLRALFVG